ncbi:MAG: cytochrome c oxidase subunit II [Candidatus Binataceae bacterium]|nr:cytochrome c oxidase subunit II [Candidatus Binataceae bacterium]
MRSVSRLNKFVGSGLLAAMVFAFFGCGNFNAPMQTFASGSDLAKWITSLYIQITIWDSIVLAIVLIVLALAIFVFSTREGDPTEPHEHESDLMLELAWTIAPALILMFITIPTVRTIMRTQPSKWPANAITVQVHAHQWWWEFDYPGLHIATGDEVHIPINRVIHFELYSDDIIHSFWIPALGGKRDVIPGQVNQITLIPSVTGEFYGQCAEFCGLSHANMRFRMVVDTADGFKQWVAAQQAPPVEPQEAAAKNGEKIFKNAPCAICHTVRGISGFSKQYDYGFRGPDLTHFGSRGTLAGSIFDNNPKNLAMWIQDPEKVKPGARMPTLGLRGTDLHDLVAYLESLK